VRKQNCFYLSRFIVFDLEDDAQLILQPSPTWVKLWGNIKASKITSSEKSGQNCLFVYTSKVKAKN
jgi:hypothetical protein